MVSAEWIWGFFIGMSAGMTLVTLGMILERGRN